ncbi:unnamed protein product [Linum tenue]|uniref:Uncharacterized protein n=1 Tax=Linum tenue TaxID=586396 RepID=A0AAV0Q7S2_9ROSI|nr:unnamed protein product [Linum tenue]
MTCVTFRSKKLHKKKWPSKVLRLSGANHELEEHGVRSIFEECGVTKMYFAPLYWLLLRGILFSDRLVNRQQVRLVKVQTLLKTQDNANKQKERTSDEPAHISSKSVQSAKGRTR